MFCLTSCPLCVSWNFYEKKKKKKEPKQTLLYFYFAEVSRKSDLTTYKLPLVISFLRHIAHFSFLFLHIMFGRG
jgi:hypothetical protein